MTIHPQSIIKNVLRDYHLLPLLRAHHLHGGYPMLILEGRLNIDQIVEHPQFKYVAQERGHLPELWAGEIVTFTTGEGGVFSVEACDVELEHLVYQYVKQALTEMHVLLTHDAQMQIQEHRAQIAELPEEAQAAWVKFTRLPGIDPATPQVTPPKGGLKALSRAERLDRARALQGLTVMSAFELEEGQARDAQRSAQQQAYAHLAVEEPDEDISMDDVLMIKEQQYLYDIESQGDWA